MNEPKLRFPEFIGNWKQYKISEVGNIVTGSTPKTSISENYGGDFLFVSPADIQGNRYVDKTITTLTKKGFDQGRKIREKASLFVSIGSTIGKVAQTHQELTTNQQINAVEPYNNFDDDFIFTSLENVAANIKAIASNQAVPIVNKTTFGNVEIRVPSELVEQQKIGSLFAELDTLIQSAEKELEGYRELKQGMLQKMFPKKGELVPEIRFPEYSGEWGQCKVGEITKFHKQGFYTTEEYDENKKYYLLRGTDLARNKLILKDTPKVNATDKDFNAFKVEVGDFLIVRSGTVGTYGIVDVDIPAIFGSYLIDFRFDLNQVTNEFFACFYQSDLFKSQLNKIIQASANTNINAENIKSTTISLPSIDEQKKIGEYFQNLDNLIASQEQELEGYKELKKGLLQQMFC